MGNKHFCKIIFNIFIAAITVFILRYVFNLYFAVGYLLILVVHEAGHYAAARYLRIKVSFGGFTPFGAYVIHENIENCRENAVVAISGPVFGSALGLAFYSIYCFTYDNTFLALSFAAVITNLLNLIPVKPLDGGHIAEAISPKLCYVGLPFLLYMFMSAERLKSKIISGVILIVGICQTYSFTKKHKTDLYFSIDERSRKKFIASYIILVISLTLSAAFFCTMFRFDEVFASIIKL
jgi:Zn-dependent protease